MALKCHYCLQHGEYDYETLTYSSTETLARKGITARSNTTLQHMSPHPRKEEDGQRQYSTWSCDQFKLKQENWFALELSIEYKNSNNNLVEPMRSTSDHEETWFHGTCWGNAQLIMKAGFIVGPGTHKKRKRTHQGLWCTTTLGNSAHRCQTNRFIEGCPKRLRMACPVVIEFKMAELSPTNFRDGKRCFEHNEGQTVEGFQPIRIHFNKKWCYNWMNQEKYHRELTHEQYQWRRCGCQLCGAFLKGENDVKWTKWEKSNNRVYYDPQCLIWKSMKQQNQTWTL